MKKMLPPALVLFCLLGMLLLHGLIPLTSFPSPMVFAAGLGILVFGLGMAASAENQFRKAGTNVSTFGWPMRLVTDGWFKYSRNPMYLSLALILAGAWMMLGSLSPILGIITFLSVADRWYIPYEESRLVETFGKEYESYRMRTRRWL